MSRVDLQLQQRSQHTLKNMTTMLWPRVGWAWFCLWRPPPRTGRCYWRPPRTDLSSANWFSAQDASHQDDQNQSILDHKYDQYEEESEQYDQKYDQHGHKYDQYDQKYDQHGHKYDQNDQKYSAKIMIINCTQELFCNQPHHLTNGAQFCRNGPLHGIGFVHFLWCLK